MTVLMEVAMIKDLRAHDIEGTVAELKAAGVVFEEYDFPGF
jgi:hypothetical protein